MGVFFLLADSPGTAKFLSHDDQDKAVERMDTVDCTAKNKLSWDQIRDALMDYKNYTHTLIHWACNYSFAGLSNFLPTIVKDMGFSPVNAQGLTAPAYFASFLCCMGAAYLSDTFKMRGFIVAIFATIGALGYGILAGIQDQSQTGARYLGVWLAACGVFPALCINMVWLMNNQGGDSKRGAGLAILGVLGQTSSFLSSVMFPDSDE